MINEKVIICGVCKNVEQQLPHTIKIMEKIGTLFQEYRIVVCENNSTDKTTDILSKWKSENRKVIFYFDHYGESFLEKTIINKNVDGSYFKPDLIAIARNKVLNIIEKNEYKQFDGYDYVIWMDMDFVKEPDYDGFIETFKRNDWDAVFANGIAPNGEYWDWFAFRDEIEPFGPEIIGHDEWYQDNKRKYFLEKRDDWYPVYSAFGGCGIYKKEVFRDCKYSARVTLETAKFYNDFIINNPEHKVVQEYLKYINEECADNRNTFRIRGEIPGKIRTLMNMQNHHLGIKTDTIETFPNIIWRMNSLVYTFPGLCEHVPLHFSMINSDYNKLFINPRLKFYY